MQRFAAVIFDMDGLLLDSERIALKAFKDTCEAFGVVGQEALFMRCIGTNKQQGDRILREGLGVQVDYAEFGSAWYGSYRAATEGIAVPLKEGVMELLSHIKSLGIAMGVATSTQTEQAHRKLEHAGIFDYFTTITCGDQVAESKPNPAIYLQAAKSLNADPGQCLALEDSENGVRAAVGAGMLVIQIPDLVQPSEALLGLGHLVLGSLNEVVDYDFSVNGRDTRAE